MLKQFRDYCGYCSEMTVEMAQTCMKKGLNNPPLHTAEETTADPRKPGVKLFADKVIWLSLIITSSTTQHGVRIK